MKSRKLILMKISLMSLCGFHILMHVLYLAPLNPAAPQYSKFVTGYMNSFFSQNWHLFAPEPATASLDLEYRCQPSEAWKSPLRDLFKTHKSFPFTSKGKQTYVIQNLAREIFNGKLRKKDDSEIKELSLAHQFLKDRCGLYSQAEFQVKRIYTKDYSKRLTSQKGAVEVFGFKVQKGEVAWTF